MIEVYKNIIKRLNHLNEYSSHDFINMSRDLMSHHSRANSFIEDTLSIQKIVKQEIPRYKNDILKELKEVFNDIDKYTLKVNEQIKLNKNDVEDLMVNVSCIIDSINSIKIDIDNVSDSLKKSYTSNTANLSVDKVFETVNNAEYACEFLLKYFNDFLFWVSKYYNEYKNSFDSQLGIFENVKQNFSVINKDVLTQSNDLTYEFNLLMKSTVKCRQNINNVIISLQYHDIIKQKIDHIVKVNLDLIKEYDNIIENQNEKSEFYNKITEIAKLHICQLLLINKECQVAVDSITTNLTSLLDEIIVLSDNEKVVLKNLNISFNNLILKLSNSKEYTSKLNTNNFKYEVVSKNVENYVENIIGVLERSSDAFNYLLKFEAFYNEVIDNKELSKLINEVVHIKKRINIISGLINQHNNLFFKIQVNIERLDSILKSNKSTTLINKLTDSYVDFMDFYFQKNELLKNHTNSHSSLKNELFFEIKPTINHLNTSSYFESQINEVIEELYKIEKLYENIDKRKNILEDLKYIEPLYTMKSERVVHEAICEKTDKNEKDIVENIEINNDSNIELF